MVKIVIDTNAWISGFFYGGTLGRVVKLLDQKDFTIIFSNETFAELTEKFLEKGKEQGSVEEAIAFLAEVNQKGSFVYPTEKVFLCRDPDDNKFLETALEAKADYLISGDKDLQALKKFHQTKILSPGQFLSKFSIGNPWAKSPATHFWRFSGPKKA